MHGVKNHSAVRSQVGFLTKALRRAVAGLLVISGAVAVMAATAPPAQALLTTLYVDEVGSDADDCSTPATACATITHALTQAASGATIEVSGTIHDNLDISIPVTISGANAPVGSPAVIDGSNAASVFLLQASGLITFESVLIQHGSSQFGGGIWATAGPVTLIDTTVSANTAYLDGAGIYSNATGDVTLINSTVTGNATTCVGCLGGRGGGLYSTGLNGGGIVIVDSTVSGNTSRTGGGGIGGFGSLTVTRSTISGNATQASGGGIYGGAITLTDSTISGNTAIFGGGVYAFGWLQAIGSTVAANVGVDGGGITNELVTITLGDTIVTDNTGGNCDNAGEGGNPMWVSLGYNLTNDSNGAACGLTGATDSVNANPDLGPLTDNGGPTRTMMPAGAAAIGKVPLGTTLNSVAVCPGLDQRGFTRPAPDGTACAIGAVEPGSSAPTDPEFSVSPTSKAYGNQEAGTDSAYQTFTVTNTGGADLAITTAVLTGTDPGQFTKGTDSCTGAIVTPAATCTVQVRFSPTSTGAKSAGLRFTHDAAGSPSDVALTGAGTIPGFAVSPTSKTYGGQTVGSESTYQTFTVTNTGDADLTITTAALTGADPAQFDQNADTCTGATVAPADTCTVQVRFAPTSAGAKSAALRFTHDASGSPTEVALAGTGTAPVFTVSPTSKAYGTQLVGTASTYQTFTVTNTGDADLTITTVALTGTDSAQFDQNVDTCTGATVAPTATCAIQVRFSPTTSGAKSASLRFSHNAAGSPSDIALTGTGTVQLPQTITFTTTPPAHPTVGSPHDIDATGGDSGLPVVFSVHPSTTNGSCTVNATTGLVQLVHTGSCVIAADQAGNADYFAAPQKLYPAITVAKGSQAITFTTTPPAQPTVGTSHDIDATGGDSGLPVTFSVHPSTTNNACTVNPTTEVVTFQHAGTCVIAAGQAGNADYQAAPQKLHPTITVAKGSQAITFTTTPPATATFGTSHDIDATGGPSGNPVTYSVHPTTTNNACTVNPTTGMVTFRTQGISLFPGPAATCVIAAAQAGNADYQAAPQKLYPAITVAKIQQAITFTTSPPTQPTVGDNHDIDAAGGGSGNPVTFSVHSSTTSGACAVNAGTGVVQLLQPGTCVIAANQAGDASHDLAPQRLYPAMTVKRGQEIDMTYLPTGGVVGWTVQLRAYGGGSGNPVTFISTTPAVCTVTPTGSATYLQAGTCALTLNQAGGTSYWPGTATRTIQVSRFGILF